MKHDTRSPEPGTINKIYPQMIRYFFLIILTALNAVPVMSQNCPSPLRKSNFSKMTSYDELSDYVQKLDAASDLLTVGIAGKSPKGRNLYSLLFSSSTFGKDESKIRVLIIAQQHGDEQSGKEGALMLAEELTSPSNRHIFDNIDLMIIPQMNPDGSEKNERLNGNGKDLNRNHVILTEPEIIAVHNIFNKYLFEVTLDVHEYYPFGETWKKLGYRKNIDETVGPVSNINIAESIRTLSYGSYMPYIMDYFRQNGYKGLVYSPGGPPGISYLRHSTFDINDGRQSFGIQNSFSFIQEGMNGKDSFSDNIERRAKGQMTGMMGLLNYVHANGSQIKDIITRERHNLISEKTGKKISIQSEHVRTGEKLELPVFSYSSNSDSTVEVSDYRPEVKSIYDVIKPAGYLIPRNNIQLMEWVTRNQLIRTDYSKKRGETIEQYEINSVDSIDFEGDIIINPSVSVKEISKSVRPADYLYLPASQLRGNMIVLALEPKSMLGLATYKEFAFLIKAGEKYPVLRVSLNNESL